MRRLGPAAAAFLIAPLILGAAAAATATITPAKARAIVAVDRLRQADLPGTTSVPDPLDKQAKKIDNQLTACIGGVPLARELAAAQSRGFIGKPLAFVGSFADVLPSTALVTADFAASSRTRALACDFEGALFSLSPLPKGLRRRLGKKRVHRAPTARPRARVGEPHDGCPR